MVEERKYTSKDAREKAGLSYRQLNDWESRGALPPGEREGERGWRRYSFKELFALMVCSEIRERYGIPVERLRFVLQCMLRKDANHLEAALELMRMRLNVFLMTDLKEMFVMDSDLEFQDMLAHAYFRADCPQAYIFIRLNDIAARLLEKPENAKSSVTGGIYRQVAEHRAAITAMNQIETDLLQALRSGQFDQVTVRLKDDRITTISAEGEVPPGEVDDRGEDVRVRSAAEFETFEITKLAGKVHRVRRKLPMKYTAKDNEPVLFAGIHRARKKAREKKHV